MCKRAEADYDDLDCFPYGVLCKGLEENKLQRALPILPYKQEIRELLRSCNWGIHMTNVH